MSVDDLTLELNHPMTEEEMDHLLDVDLEHTSEVEFKTKHGKRVIFVRKQSSLMTKGGWISVKDRLPERGTRCLIYAAQGKAHYTSIANFNGYFGLSGRRAYWKVTHWMPIPEPPTGDKS